MPSREGNRALGWTLAAQSTNSASNFLPILAASISLSAPDAGIVAVIVTVAQLALVCGQGLYGDPQLLRWDPDEAALRRGVGALALVLGVVAAALGGWLVRRPSDPPSSMAAASATLLIVVLEDCWRYHLLTRHVRRALLVDAVWLFSSLSLTLIFHGSAAAVTASWGMGALISLLLATIMAPSLPSRRAMFAFIRHSGSRSSALVADSLLGQLGVQATLLVLTSASIVGLDDFATVKLVGSAFGPLGVVLLGVRHALVGNKFSIGLRRLALAATAVALAYATAVGVAFLVAPPDFTFGGRAVPVSVLWGAATTLGASSYLCAAALRRRGQIRRLVSVRFGACVVQAGALSCGGLAAGSALALSASYVLAAAVMWPVWYRAADYPNLNAKGLSS